jgi:hypothetical protein
MKARPHQTQFMERVLDKFSENGSFRTTDYNKFTVCSSYTLTLIAAYIAHKDAASVLKEALTEFTKDDIKAKKAASHSPYGRAEYEQFLSYLRTVGDRRSRDCQR